MRYLFTILALILTTKIYASDIEKDLQTQFILAEPGDTIIIPEGLHDIIGTLSIDGKKDLIIRGYGMDKSILSFINQVEGAQGISITNSSNITLEDFTVRDSKGDAIKTQYVDGIIFRGITAEWTGGPKSSNGAYGLYPVQCTNVLIEFCIAIGASDAGIYVGQSKDIIVRNSKAFHNVAGIEIENSINAKVYENHSYENTGGILVFDLPDLVQIKGDNIHVYQNLIENNNLNNFAPPGNIVGNILPGTGVMILAADNVHIYENTIRNNKSVGTGIVSYFITEEPMTDKTYNPYTSNIHIYNNNFDRKVGLPTLDYEIGQLMAIKYGRTIPDIIYDGMQDPNVFEGLCLQNNIEAKFTNLDIEHNFENWYSPFISNFSEDKSNFKCISDHNISSNSY
tara:strand:+ start:321 stop:1511 length:1191 start_codon:yes stop_codon:yes gene_type:complete